MGSLIVASDEECETGFLCLDFLAARWHARVGRNDPDRTGTRGSVAEQLRIPRVMVEMTAIGHCTELSGEYFYHFW